MQMEWHSSTCNDEVDWEGAEVNQDTGKEQVLEAIEIQRHAKITNLDSGLKLDLIWIPFLSS